MNPYDRLTGKDPFLARAELAQLAEASRMTTERGLDWIVGQFAPAGPIMAEREFTAHYKAAWALTVGGRTAEATRVIDWLLEHGLQPTGDVVFPDVEQAQGVDFLRLYRQSYVLRVASRTGHPHAQDPRVRERFLRHLDPATGGVYGSLDDAGVGDPSGGFNLLVASAFGMCAVELGELDAAQAVGALLEGVVEQNDDPDAFYYAVAGDGSLDRELEPGREAEKVVRNDPATQPTHVLGIAATFLAELHVAMRAAGPPREREAQQALDAAWRIVEFEARLPYEAFFSWNRVKLAWSSGRLIEALLDAPEPDVERLDVLYRLARRTYVHTLLGTQLASGGWGHDLYPSGEDAPELAIDQRTLEGISAAPSVEQWTAHRAPIDVLWAHPLEVGGENVFVTACLARGVERLRDAVDDGRVALA
jgi:hypothetical protein